jgi:hypothetical protein
MSMKFSLIFVLRSNSISTTKKNKVWTLFGATKFSGHLLPSVRSHGFIVSPRAAPCVSIRRKGNNHRQKEANHRQIEGRYISLLYVCFHHSCVFIILASPSYVVSVIGHQTPRAAVSLRRRPRRSTPLRPAPRRLGRRRIRRP